MIRFALAGLLALAPLTGFADTVEDQIRLGMESYQAGEFRTAIDELNYAIAQIQEKLDAQNVTLLPEPLEGWSATEVESASAGMAMMGGGTSLSRGYQRGAESLEITITAGSPMVAAALTMLNNPMLLASDPTLKPYRYRRINGMRKSSEGHTEITLSVAGQIMVQLNASGLRDDGAINQYLDAMDFDRIRDTFVH